MIAYVVYRKCFCLELAGGKAGTVQIRNIHDVEPHLDKNSYGDNSLQPAHYIT